MDFSYSEDQQALRELARKILEEQASFERQKEVRARGEPMDRALWAELAKANLLGLAIPEKWGGSGLGLAELVILLEEVGRSVAPVPVLPTLVSGASALAAFGSEELQERWLPEVARGDAVLAAGLVDEGADPLLAHHDGTGWRLSGERRMVQAAALASRILLPARVEGGEPGVFLLDPRTEGVRVEPVETTDQESWAHLQLADVRVPDGEVLGELRDGASILRWIRQRTLLGLCALQVGVAGRALEITAAYVSERRQFDRPIGSFQAVHQRAGDAFVDLQAMKLTLWRALHRLEHDEDAEELLAIAKYWASEGGSRITYAAMHLHGGIGVDLDYPVHRYYLWARQIGMHLGSGSVQLARIGEGLAAGS